MQLPLWIKGQGLQRSRGQSMSDTQVLNNFMRRTWRSEDRKQDTQRSLKGQPHGLRPVYGQPQKMHTSTKQGKFGRTDVALVKICCNTPSPITSPPTIEWSQPHPSIGADQTPMESSGGGGGWLTVAVCRHLAPLTQCTMDFPVAQLAASLAWKLISNTSTTEHWRSG